MLTLYGTFALIVTVIVRILIGHLSGKYEELVAWIPIFNYIAIGVAVILASFIVVNIVKAVKK